MKRFLLALLILASCNGKLTDEQRRKIKDEMNRSKIRKLSEADITEAAFTLGRSITSLSSGGMDSLRRTHTVRWKELRTGDLSLDNVEKQIVEAYAGATPGSAGDNVQKLSPDSLLYTKPVYKEIPDGSRQFSYAIGIRLSKRQVVLSIK